MQKNGKTSVFIGMANKVKLNRNANTVLKMTSSQGVVTGGEAYSIPEDGIYEVTANFSGAASKENAIVAFGTGRLVNLLPITE